MNESKSFSAYNGLILEIVRSFFGNTPVSGAIPPAVLDALKPGAVERHFFPFRRIASRHGNMPEFMERVIKFLLIEGWKNKTRSIASYCAMFRQGPKDE